MYKMKNILVSGITGLWEQGSNIYVLLTLQIVSVVIVT
jgi:hypothetical protein